MQLSQEIFNILKGANIKLKLFDPMGNKTLDPELSARFYAYDNDFLVTIREDEDDAVELVVQAGASFNFDKHKDVLDSIKQAGHNAMAEYNIRKFDKNIEPKDFAHDVVKENEEVRRLKELSGIKEADRSDVTHAQLLPHIKNVKAAMVRHAQEDPSEANEFIEHLDDMMDAGDVEVVDMMQPDYMDTEARDSLIFYFQVSISQDPALYNMLFPGEDIKFAQGKYADMFESMNEEPKDFAHDVVKQNEEVRRLKELSGIRNEPIEEHRSEDWHCKDCGDEMHKPTTNCSHDSHDEDGDWWVDENGNGIHDKLEEVSDKEDYMAKKKAIQDLQMDPNTHKDEDLKKEIMRRKAELDAEAKEKGMKEDESDAPSEYMSPEDFKAAANNADNDGEEQKTVEVNGPVALSGDSIWFRDSKSPTSVNVGEVTSVITDGWAEVYVNHDGPWEIYTDTGFEKAISKIVGFEAEWSEQGLQQEGKAHLEGQVEMQENASVMEGFSPATGSIKTSYIQLPENTKLIIKHTKGVNEEVRGSRSRNIKALFIENSAGERFRFPYKYLQGAKAMANHVSHGGTPYDAIGESITKLCTEVAQCTQFLRHVRTNKLTNEGNANIVETVKEKLKEFKSTVKSLQTSRGYNNYQVPTTAIVEENDKESVDITGKFMYNTFETANMNAVLETVARIVKEKDGMTDLTKSNINRLYDMIKNKEDFKLNIDPNDPEHPDNEDPIKYSGGNGAMAKLVSHLSYLAMNSKNDEVFNLLSQISGEMYSLPKEHVILLAKIAKYLDKNNKAPAKEPAMEDLAEATLNSLRRKIA